MVATRRGVQTGPDEETAAEQNPDLTIRKKPGRKATAKTTTNSKPGTKAKTTRGKKAEPEPEPEPEVSEIDAPATKKRTGRSNKATTKTAPAERIEEPKPAEKPTRAANAGSLRGKRGAPAVEEAAEEPLQDEPKPTRSTKAGSVRGKKAVPSPVEEAQVEQVTKPTKSAKSGSLRGKKATAAVEAPALPAPKETKPARQTRGAASKPQPLSPKKITQVTKPQTRNTKTASQKPATKAVQNKAPVNARSTRKRNVSDENEDVLEFNPPAGDDAEDDIVMLSSTPKRNTSTRTKRNGINDSTHESDVSMSSRPTTPTDSPPQSLGTVEEEEDQAQGDNESEAEAEQNIQEESAGSEDELAGPKTPMRRTSPGAQARYQLSVQRTIRKYDEEMQMQTPARRFAVLGSQRGTPQTQKPYCKPVAPTSESRPMTVTRGTGRAFVFKDLRDGRPSPRNYESVSEQDEISFLPDEDIIPSDTTPSPEEPIYLESQPEPLVERGDDSAMTSVSVHEDRETDYVVPAAVQKYSDDPDDTVVIHDLDDDAEAHLSDPSESFHTEDTVLIGRPEQAELDDVMMDDDIESDAGSVIIHSSQTNTELGPAAVNEPVRGAAILVNFDEHLTDVRTTPEDDTGVLGAESAYKAPVEDEQNAVAGADMDLDQDHHHTLQAESRRQTVNFNEYIDVAALSEPTAVLNLGDEVANSVPASVDMSLGAGDLGSFSDPIPHTALQTVQAEPNSPEKESSVSAIMDVDAVEAQSETQQNATNVDGGEPTREPPIPHYALPTISFDARRKSLPSFSHRTPVKIGTRPNTSDGASMPRIANPFANAWWAQPAAGSTVATPVKARPGTSHATPTRISFGTPGKTRPSAVVSFTPVATPKDRYPLLSARKIQEGYANFVAAPARFGAPSEKSPKRRETFHKDVPAQSIARPNGSFESTPVPGTAATPKERYPVFTSRANYEDRAKTVTAPVRFQTPPIKSPKRRKTFDKAASGQNNLPTDDDEIATPVQNVPVTPQVASTERYPRLRPRQDYTEHAKTVAGPVRFQTPAKTPLKRPATGGKPDSLRKAALMASTPVSSETQMRTPLKAPAMTPSQIPMTPHPAAPLRGVVAVVEVFTLEGASASAPFVALLHRLGAKTTRSWSDRITHVIFKDGSPLTLQRVRLNNKEFGGSGKRSFIHCVNSRWVTDCDTEGAHVDASGEEYVVDVSEVPRGGKRRRKSMEPAALLNLGGNIVRDRQSSLSRNRSLSRSPLKLDSPAKKPDESLHVTPEVDMNGKENSGDEQGSPATPAWIAAPGQLVQKTAPMKRVRKLELPGKEAKNRRLTFWNGAA